jgi:hypothetical protein
MREEQAQRTCAKPASQYEVEKERIRGQGPHPLANTLGCCLEVLA